MEFCYKTVCILNPSMGLNIYKHDPSADWRFFTYLPDGRALLSCHARNAVIVVDSAGDEVERLDAEFSKPEGIAFQSNGNILVVDRFNHAIRVFDRDLKQLRSIVTDFQEPGRLNQPVGIAVNPKDDSIWVADNENHRVLHLDSRGVCISALGKGYGSDPGYMFCPCGVALFTHQNHGELIIVSEWGGGRVQVFRADGSVFGVYGGVCHAHHVVVDAEGCIYVTEYATRKIKKFSLDGDFVGGGPWGVSAVSLVAGATGMKTVVTQNEVVVVLDCGSRKKRRLTVSLDDQK